MADKGHGSMTGASTGQVLSYAIRCKKCKQCDQKKSEVKEKVFHVKNLVLDYDSKTITRAKSSFDSSLKKISDFNHTKKNFTSKLYDLKKPKKYTLLGPKTIKHLTKCFAYVVKSNSDNAKLKKNLESVP